MVYDRQLASQPIRARTHRRRQTASFSANQRRVLGGARCLSNHRPTPPLLLMCGDGDSFCLLADTDSFGYRGTTALQLSTVFPSGLTSRPTEIHSDIYFLYLHKYLQLRALLAVKVNVRHGYGAQATAHCDMILVVKVDSRDSHLVLLKKRIKQIYLSIDLSAA